MLRHKFYTVLTGARRKKKLDALLGKYQVQPVGWGYIDAIVTMDNIEGFIEELTALKIRITTLTWWCHYDSCHVDEPHGGGGPHSWYYDGWFSEMYHIPVKLFSDNSEVLPYIRVHLGQAPEIPDCCVPGLWLKVPKRWHNQCELNEG